MLLLSGKSESQERSTQLEARFPADRQDAGGVSGTGDTAGILGATGRNARNTAGVTNYHRELSRQSSEAKK
ncbi:MAG: hypothetical protein ACOVNV_05995 [Pirellulaceae bacterium]